MNKRKVWRVRAADPALLYIFQHELGVSPVLAGIMANRGITTVEEARLFLEGGLDGLHDPLLMADMGKAVRRIRAALDSGEKILVYGDYDADGVTATALLVKLFTRLGAPVGFYIPHRIEEGYGLHTEALRRAGREGYGLVVTVDCGISAIEEVALNRAECGPDIVITDHHQPPGEIPAAAAVINPKRADCPYPFKELAGVGVALKLARALLEHCGPGGGDWTDYLDLACLGTVADIVPLTAENRIIVRYGLPALAGTGSPGIRALMEVSGVKPDRLDVREVGFALAPRLNAAGRVGDAARAVELLLAGDPEEAWELASLLHRGNQERQRIESLVLAEAMGMLDADPSLTDGRVIVLSSPRWHPGVLGIVASRLVDRYYRPVLLITLDGAEGKGSGRSISGFHLYDALTHCGDLLNKFGGHAQAVGFSLPVDRLASFREALNQYADSYIDGETFVPGVDLDATVPLKDITDGLVEEIQMLAPFGYCNPGPVLACRGVALLSCREAGRNGEHLKMTVGEDGAVLEGIAFRMASSINEIAAASEVDLAFFPSFNTWKGRRSVQLEVKEIRPAGGGWRNEPPGGRSAGIGVLCGTGPRTPVESLRRVGPLALVPEFIPAVLHRYREKSDRFIYPGRYLQYFPGPAPADYGQTGRRPRIMKDRPGEYRPARLYSLIHRGCGNLVLVNSPGRAVELAFFLNRAGIPAAFVHPGVLPGETGLLMESFSSGAVGALVCTYGSMPADVNPRRIVLYDLPYSPEEAGPALGAGAECHPLFKESDLRAGLEYLESLAPGRDRLAELYIRIRAGGSGCLDSGQVVEFMRRRGLSRAGLHTLAFGLAVFADLGLLEYCCEEDGYRVMHSAVNGKRELSTSATFAAGREIRLNTEEWWKSLYI